MPFHGGAYYPYPSGTQGTHSSAGIPSLLSSPLSQHSANSHPAPGMTPSSGASISLPFKFRPRRESVDWRRINAVDVDQVVSQLDVDALQEYISTVTFCSLDGERCQRCQNPVDPALVKLLRLAQLTVEWLIHCQEFLTLNLHAAEERLAACGVERKELLAQQSRQEEKIKSLGSELKQRKKFIRTQQSLLRPAISTVKCMRCEKSFIHGAFLQSHMQRRHPEEYESQSQAEGGKRSLVDALTLEINSLKEQIAQQQQTLQDKMAQEKEQQSLHKDLLRELDRFKAEELARMDRKIEDSKDGMRREMEVLYSRNVHALNEVNQNQTAKKEKSTIIQKLEHQLRKQDKKWESMQQDIKAQHESEKNQLRNELSRMQSSVSERQDESQRQQQEMRWMLQEKDDAIKGLRQQIKNISSNPPTKAVEAPAVADVPAPEPRPSSTPSLKRVAAEEPAFALDLDPIRELSEEEEEQSSVSERRPAERRPEPVPQKKQAARAPRRSPSVKEVRLELEQGVLKKLENLGVKQDQSGLKNKELASLLAKVHSKRDSMTRDMPDFWRQREAIASSVEEKVGGRGRSEPAPLSHAKSRPSAQVLQIRPRSSSLPSRASQVTGRPAARQHAAPQPLPRTKSASQPKTSTPNAKAAPRTFARNLDDESEEESSDPESEQPPNFQRSRSPPVQIKAGKSMPVRARPAPARQTLSPKPQGSAGATKTVVAKTDDDDDDDTWSDVSELQEIDLPQFHAFKDQNGNVDKKNYGKENKINVLARKMEQQFAARTAKKPAGGVSILTEGRDEVQELKCTDLEESHEWLTSFEDRREKNKGAPGSGSLRKSLDSPSTSVWDTSTAKGPKSGAIEDGTGSTLKSSLCSISDISDSEDVSGRHGGHAG